MYKQIKPLPEEGKIECDYGQELFLQRSLFNLGYTWTTDKGLPHTELINVPTVIWGKNKKLSWTAYKDSKTFMLQPEPLHIFTDYFTTEPTN